MAGSDETAAGSPHLVRKVGFWALLGLTSTAFAEVLFPTTPFDIGTMVLIAVPVYLLHSVVLAGVVFRRRVGYPALYLAGVLLGLYEAYVTKVVWAPVGNPIAGPVAGVYPFETASLVLFWHPLFAFVVPVAVVEWAGTDSTRSLVPPVAGHRYATHLAVAVAAFLAVFQGSLGAGPAATLLTTLGALAVLGGVLMGWRSTGGHRFAMASLLPSGRELWALGAALAGLYVLFGTTIRPDMLPRRPSPHLVVLGVYAVVVGLFLATRRRADGPGVAASDASTDPPAFTWPRVLAATGAFALASAGAGLVVRPFRTVVFLSYFAVGLVVGVASLIYVVLALRQ